ncbi:MAG: hypothetical protein R8P61_18030 [Bacteroidia bacterium]|nr:hypothetical protein [Bacteroidia bacterium]
MLKTKKDRYFFILHSLLLLLVLLGFAPSFYLRPLSNQAALPFHLLIHGISCTSWFILCLLQVYLIQSHRTLSHKKLGTSASILAPAIFLSGLWVMYHRIQNFYVKNGNDLSGRLDYREFESMLIWGDIFVLISFLLLVYLGYRFRQKIHHHKRYMLFASIMIVPQAFVRIGKLPFLQLGDDPGASGSIYAVLGPVLILLSLIFYDRKTLGKVHPVTKLSWGWYIGLLAIATLLMRTGWGADILEVFQ